MAVSNVTYAASGNFTITLAALATSSTLVAGRESTALDNGANLWLDAIIGGVITVGTTPTIDTNIEVWLYGSRNDTPDYPDVLDGTDSAETMTTAAIKRAALKLVTSMRVDTTTSDRSYYFGPYSAASFFGGVLPDRWGVFVTHNTGVNLNATGSNHEISYTGVTATST